MHIDTIIRTKRTRKAFMEALAKALADTRSRLHGGTYHVTITLVGRNEVPEDAIQPPAVRFIKTHH